MAPLGSLDVAERIQDSCEGKKKSLRKNLVLGSVCVVAALVFCGCYLYFRLRSAKDSEIVQEYGISLPEDWYYERALMDLPQCDITEEKVLRKAVVVDYLYRLCDDVESCAVKVRSMANASHFFITVGHVFEGLGWHCGVTESLRVVFLGDRDQYDEIAFHKLLMMGVESHEISPHFHIVDFAMIHSSSAE